MAQVLFTTAVVVSASSPINVKVGFQPGKVEIINLNSVATPVDGEIWKNVWQYGMSSGAVINTVYQAVDDGVGTSLVDQTVYSSSNGISLLGFAPGAEAQYGAVVSGFTNANPGVITVDSTSGISAGCVIRVEAVADDQTGTASSLNGVYTVASVTATTITTTTNTSVTGYSVYVSGGFVTLVSNANAVIPNPPNNIYSNVPSWYNQAIQGIRIGTSALTNADASDVLLVGVWDRNSGGL